MIFYPLKFEDNFHEAIWGGGTLARTLGKGADAGACIGESWELSGHPRGVSIVANGSLKGLPVTALVQQHPVELLGKVLADRFTIFPVLIKLVDASERLSIQVHPDDAYAASRSSDKGKSEAWYIIDAKDNSSVLCGFNRAINIDEARTAIEAGQFDKYLRKLCVKAGDTMFIPAGTAHAVMGGVLLYEIQEMSDITYRISDWGRTGPDGRSRPLNIEDALAVMRYDDVSDHRTNTAAVARGDHESVLCVASRYFVLERFTINNVMEREMTGSFDAMTILCGSGSISHDGGVLPFSRGETILMPAELKKYKIICDKPVSALVAYVPESDGAAIDRLHRDGLDDEAIRGLGDLLEK